MTRLLSPPSRQAVSINGHISLPTLPAEPRQVIRSGLDFGCKHTVLRHSGRSPLIPSPDWICMRSLTARPNEWPLSVEILYQRALRDQTLLDVDHAAVFAEWREDGRLSFLNDCPANLLLLFPGTLLEVAGTKTAVAFRLSNMREPLLLPFTATVKEDVACLTMV